MVRLSAVLLVTAAGLAPLISSPETSGTPSGSGTDAWKLSLALSEPEAV